MPKHVKEWVVPEVYKMLCTPEWIEYCSAWSRYRVIVEPMLRERGNDPEGVAEAKRLLDGLAVEFLKLIAKNMADEAERKQIAAKKGDESKNKKNVREEAEDKISMEWIAGTML